MSPVARTTTAEQVRLGLSHLAPGVPPLWVVRRAPSIAGALADNRRRRRSADQPTSRDMPIGYPPPVAGPDQSAPNAPSSAAAAERRAATLEEARALSHPIRLRILRLCLDESLTNKELAARLGLHPGTVLHHVRALVTTGFLTEDEWRRGPRGTTEKPYRSTGKSWRLDIEESGQGPAVLRAMLDAVGVELDEAGPDAVVESARMAMRLAPAQLERLHGQILDLIGEYADTNEPDGTALAMLILLHRRK
jgi:DNA-binding transcriptional ArsR family regulator